ncbi:MAG: InlB B-repeat-containing protein [Oscillospiraceae bacterium]|nr:InlB B-repeat-containing protein [Oscillospiraceae bacterium]
MYKIKGITKKIGGAMRRVLLLIMALTIICTAVSLFSFPVRQVYAEEPSSTTTDNRRLQNGSFEEGQTWTEKYKQPNQDNVPAWNTTAFEGKIEMFRENSGTYLTNVTLSPTDGFYAAELNADEESTLFQVVDTMPSSIYEWGLDHGARNGTDTMALVIGPNQDVKPSKPSKDGRDHFMQMIDWLIAQRKTSVKTSAGLGEHLVVYSKKFAAGGTFADNAGNNAFSLTPSTIYTEEWHIWIMASSKATSGTNPWNSYGSNAESTEENGNGTGFENIYYHYTVPAGQTETLFGFVSVGYVEPSVSGDKAKTYGNFLDNINFQIYHALSGSTTIHGSAVVSGSDGTTGGGGSSNGHKVTVENKLATYVKDGEPLTIQAIIKKDDFEQGCEFVGTYYTKQDENGNPVVEMLKLSGNCIDYSDDLTEADKKGKWVKTVNADGDVIYTYQLDNLTSATDLRFIFIKSPTVTYDPNGGKAYEVERKYNTNEPQNVYSFKPGVGADEASEANGVIFINPYVSHAAEGQNDGWKFLGWLLTGDENGPSENYDIINSDQLGSMILPAEHTISCDYAFKDIGQDEKMQYFKIYNQNVSLTKSINNNSEGKPQSVQWTAPEGTIVNYANLHKGITMVAQWRWRQAAIPLTKTGASVDYDESDVGGTVEITSVTDPLNENYNAAYNANGGKSYHAETNEKVTIKAIPKENFTFEGWYDESGKLITTNDEYSYSESKESVKTFYARFSDSVTQKYIRQVWNPATEQYEDTEDNTIATLGRYEYTDSKGKPISSTANVGTGYTFVGWFDSEGHKVADDMLINDGATISYTTTGDATYYARFAKKITQTFIRQVKNGDTWKDTTDNAVGTLTLYTHTGLPLENVKSKAEPGEYYNFDGWFDSGGNAVSEDKLTDNGKTIRYNTTKDETYYARFSKKLVTQRFIRQIKNGDSWEDITDDTIGTLSLYLHENEEVLQEVESEAIAEAGYVFVGWYDAEGNKVSSGMLTNYRKTIKYTTTGNATYYARFENAYSLSVSKINGDKSTEETKVSIPGVEFTLYKADETGDVTLTYNGESIPCYAVHSDVTVIREGSSEATAVFDDMLAASADYYLAETKVPTGYRFLEGPVKITIDSTGTFATINGKSKEITGKKLSIELANYLTLTMPVSGTLFTGSRVAVIGLLILTSAVIGLFILKLNRFKSIDKK